MKLTIWSLKCSKTVNLIKMLLLYETNSKVKNIFWEIKINFNLINRSDRTGLCKFVRKYLVSFFQLYSLTMNILLYADLTDVHNYANFGYVNFLLCHNFYLTE